MTEHPGPTLTDAKGMGGVNAQDGFDYQVWDAVVRIPAWLRSPVFEGLTVEGLEDVEARFFAPHAPRGHFLDRFQAKSAHLTRGQVIEVFKGFAAFDDAHAGAARAHVLVTPSLPKELQWLEKDSERVRRARPFYAPFPDVIAASDQKLERDIVADFGPDLGTRVARSYDVSTRVFPNRVTAEAMFAGVMEQTFGVDLSARKSGEAFRAIATHLVNNCGTMVARSTLLRLIGEVLGAPLISQGPLPVHVRSDRNAPAEDAIEIDASAFSGMEGSAPAAEEWKTSLAAPLERTAKWAHHNGHTRVRITGSYRISTAFALGWSFRAATGFELEIPTRGGDWVTDDRLGPQETKLPWEITAPTELHNGRLVVSIGVLRDAAQDARALLGLESGSGVLRAYLDRPVTSGREAQDSVQALKNAVVAQVARLAPRGIDLFYAGPAAMAIALGHRWNAMPATQLHEFRPTQGYVPSAVLR
ncbi:MAG TPA: SAVED domain-containing protein [Longimicrobium sp.]|nr:SAVED domain-containing protein [Longimicrobium sp.]